MKSIRIFVTKNTVEGITPRIYELGIPSVKAAGSQQQALSKLECNRRNGEL